MRATHPSDRLIRQRITALERGLYDARRGKVDAVHQARVATRRLRAALPLVVRGPKGRRLAEVIRELTRALGAVRELDVMKLTLREFERRGDMPAGGVACLRRVISDERKREWADLADQIARCDFDRLQKKALAAARRGEGDASRGRRSRRSDSQVAGARTRAARRAEALREAIETAGGMYLPDRLHRVRIAVKKLRYEMEIVRELSGSRATARIRSLRDAQDLLGRMHDLDVLISRIRALQGSDHAANLRLSAELDELVRRIEMECRRLHGRYMSVRKTLASICEHVSTVAEEGRHVHAPM